MISKTRKYFNDRWTASAYQSVKDHFQANYPDQLGFRISESPIFLDSDFKKEIFRACDAIIDQLLDIPEEIYKSRVPKICNVPNCPPRPQMLSIDFGICEVAKNKFVPKLIELQAFPSLFFYQFELANQYQKDFTLPDHDGFLLDGMNNTSFIDAMRRVIIGDYATENVILLEVYPDKQKTKIDFVLTKKYLGIEVVCLTEIVKKGKDLFYRKDGNLVQIHRIFNRVILDELDRYTDVDFPFSFSDEINVEWITHPEWYFRISKYLLPILKDESIPEAYFLNQLPDKIDLKDFVLKPLYSFSGTGINIHPTHNDIAVISDPENYILQRKVSYASIFQDMEGESAKAEIRILYTWHADDARPKPMINLVRMTKSEMINIDHNKANLSFTGSSIAFFIK